MIVKGVAIGVNTGQENSSQTIEYLFSLVAIVRRLLARLRLRLFLFYCSFKMFQFSELQVGTGKVLNVPFLDSLSLLVL